MKCCLARLFSVLADLQWTWSSFDCFKRANGQLVYLAHHPEGWWQHVLREDLRRWIWNTDPQLLERKDIEGSKLGINYHVTTAILRRAERSLAHNLDEDEADDSQRLQQPLLLNASDVAVPKVTREQLPFLRALLQGATITGR